jgi:hypothetical protein
MAAEQALCHFLVWVSGNGATFPLFSQQTPGGSPESIFDLVEK